MYLYKFATAVLVIVSARAVPMPPNVTEEQEVVPIDEIILGDQGSPKDEGRIAEYSNDVVVEADMVFTREEWEKLKRLDSTRRKKRKALRGTWRRWPNKQVPYTVASYYSGYQRSEVESGLAEIQKYSCITFRQATSFDRNRVTFADGTGCSSNVGMRGGTQYIRLKSGCRQQNYVVHEMGHALGLFHEQSRPDRDNYVTILTQNIQPGLSNNFGKYSTRIIDTYGVEYDYRSIMHYGSRFFSRNGGYTIQTKDPAYQNIIGRARQLSFRDIKVLNLMYSCSAQCSYKPTCPGEGFVGKDCKCWCPGNPVQECNTGGGSGTGNGGSGTGSGGSGTGNCEDSNKDCDAWMKSGYCTSELYQTYMKQNCKKSCGICTESGTGGSGGNGNGACQDTETMCQQWAGVGFCNDVRYKDTMQKNCRASCGLCNGGTGGSGGSGNSCTDLHQSCSTWGAQGYCTQSFVQFMTTNCKKTCNLCSGGTGGGGTGNGDCIDNTASCPQWASGGFCADARYAVFMRNNCKKSCGVCSSGVVCQDKQTICRTLVQQNMCTNAVLLSYMSENCRQSCGFC